MRGSVFELKIPFDQAEVLRNTSVLRDENGVRFPVTWQEAGGGGLAVTIRTGMRKSHDGVYGRGLDPGFQNKQRLVPRHEGGRGLL